VKRFFLLTLAAGLLGAGQGIAADKNPVVVLDTSMGTIKIELLADKAPVTVKNMLSYVDDKFYDGTIFHRVMKGFMIQGGGLDRGIKEKNTKDPIKNEASNGLENKRGTVAMARTPAPDSATAQFFINHADNAFLDKENARDRFGYCVFGKVIDGMDVVDKIADVQVRSAQGTDKNGRAQTFDNVPAQEVVIKSIRLEKGGDKK